MVKGNVKSRSYDLAIPPAVLAKVVERRRTPDGLCHDVNEIKRAGRRVYDYPFAQMELGDFFIVYIGNRSEKALRIAFYQAAARNDYEIAVTPWKMPGGSPGLRVTVVIIGLTRYKRELDRMLDMDAALPKDERLFKGVKRPKYSDGKWAGRKRIWERDTRQRSGSRAALAPKEKKPKSNDPFWADNDPELPIDKALAAVQPEQHLDRAEAIRRALGEDA